MKIIYKYVVGDAMNGDGVRDIALPEHAEFLSVGNQYGAICAWYLVDPDEAPARTDRWFQVGTGHRYGDEILDASAFRGSIIADPFVWHMFCTNLTQ